MLQRLMDSFPVFRDAFDPDDLPLAFIITRDAHLAESRASRRRQLSSPPAPSSSRPPASSRPRRRPGRRMPTSDA